MTRKKNAEPCPRCKLIRQEWRRGSYMGFMVRAKLGKVHEMDCGLMCWSCIRDVSNLEWNRAKAARDSCRFAENEMWSLEPGALT